MLKELQPCGESFVQIVQCSLPSILQPASHHCAFLPQWSTIPKMKARAPCPVGPRSTLLHHHQVDGGLGVQGGLRSILLTGVLALAVIQHAGDEENQEQDDVARNQDDQVQGDRVNLQVKFHRIPHGWEVGLEKGSGASLGVARSKPQLDGITTLALQ